MGLIYPVYREADLVVLASPMYYWGFSGQLKTAFDRLFAVAECFPGYANPHKECALVMAAEGDSADNWKPVLDYYHALLGFLGWKDRGQVLAGGRVRSRCRGRAACSGPGVPLRRLAVGLSQACPVFFP